MIDRPDPENAALKDIIADNVEEIAKQHFGADEATATVKRKLDEGEWRLDITYEGELDDTDSYFAVDDGDGIQAFRFFEHITESRIKGIYLMKSYEEIPPSDKERLGLE